MAKIDTNSWETFVFGEVFEMQSQKEISPIYALNNTQKSDIMYPFLGQSSENNCIISYIYLDDELLLNNKEKEIVIIIHSNNHLSFCIDEPFYLKDGHGATSIFKNIHLDKYNVRFIIAVLNRTMDSLFTYDVKATKDSLKKMLIKLPATSGGEPDWDYMSSYMKKIMEESKIYLEKLNQVKNNKELINVTQWQRFHLYDDELFDIDMGTKMDKAKMTELNPEVNFVGRANNNNGITACIDKIEGVEPYAAGNMTLSLGGEYLGSCFIQPDVFYTSQNVVVLVPKWDMSFEVKQFISAMIFKESRLYYKAFVDELNRHIKTDFTFLLPVEADNKPDWKYMEQYMKDMIDVSEKVIENFELLNIC